MKFHNLFPKVVGEKIIDSDIVSDEYIQKIKNFLSTIKTENISLKTFHITEEQRLFDHEIFNNLKTIILSEVFEYSKQSGLPAQDFQISNSWALIASEGQGSGGFHYHSNSYISGVFYLTEGADIEFYNDSLESLSFKPMISENKETYNKHHYKISPRKNLLLLFPSNLYHRVLTNTRIIRYSLPFNIIPKGEFGDTYAKVFL
jgi:uncharacterized protein (TIGR02466 family)